MPDETKPAGEQGTLPLDDKAAKAEERARAAEERAAKLEADKAAREDAARKRDAEKKAKKAADLDSANSRIAELEERERKATERVLALEKQRVDDHLSGLTDEQRKVAEKYRARMDTDAFLELVADMFKPNTPNGESQPEGTAAPPAAAPRGPGPKIKPQGRELHAETLQVLREHMNENPEAEQRLLHAQHSGSQYRHIVPVDKLIRFMRERVNYPKRLSPDQRKRLLDSVQ